MKNILENLGLCKYLENYFQIDVEIPTRRIDLKRRKTSLKKLAGFTDMKISKNKLLDAEALGGSGKIRKEILKTNCATILAGLGFSEVMNYSFYGADDIAKCNLKIEDHIEVANPLSPDQQYLRRSLVPNILKNVELESQKLFRN